MRSLARMAWVGLFLPQFALVASAQAPSGQWRGTIDVPGNALEITVDLGQDGNSWVGQIDIPAQGMNDFPLADVGIDGTSVSFAIPGVPGEPTFRGTLAEGKIITGELSQGGGKMPFRLERTGDAELTVSVRPKLSAEMAAALPGRWAGTLDVPGRPLRVAFVLGSDADGKLTAAFDSPDEGRAGMPVTGLSLEGNSLRAELSYAGAAFEGELNDARTELVGAWQQGGGSLPLTLKKEAAAGDDQGAAADAVFPEADPQSVGIPARALDMLTARLQSMVANEEIVGGELLVVKDRRTVLREAFGWQDRESELELEPGSVYCVRSMTKPLVGTAIQMLIDEGKLRLDTPVRDVLPFFAGPRTGKITVEHLLTHTGGFPFTTLERPLSEYTDLADVAAEAAKAELLFEPGARFEYSDAGSDTLGAMVATITGAPVEQFIEERILGPLTMSDTFTQIGDDQEVLDRIPSAYSGGTGSWSKHWQSSDSPIFPLFLTSQSLYSTTTDYARFLALWMDGGRVGDRRLLSAEAVARGLEPRQRMTDYLPGFDGLDVYYGQQWTVYTESTGQDGSLELFGHSGSDGTHAWAWPEHDLMVLFFTQSRGTLAGVGLERMLQTLLVDQTLDDPSLHTRVPSTEELDQVAGLYWDQSAEHAYYVITRAATASFSSVRARCS